MPRLVPSSVTGTASGLANAIWQLGSVLVPLAVGAVFSATGSFDAAFITLAAGPVLAMLVTLPVRDNARRRNGVHTLPQKKPSQRPRSSDSRPGVTREGRLPAISPGQAPFLSV